MAGNLSEMMARVTVNEAEEEVVGYEGEGLENTLLGRVHTDRPYSFQRMKRALTAAWRPRRPISFHELDTNMFLVKLDHFVDLKRVLEDGPWSFQRNLVLLKPIDNDEQPSQQVMTMVPFWIRLVNVPLSRRNKSHVGGGIASKLGQVMEIDNAYFINRGKHIRARVMINITKPLCRYVTVLNFHNTKVQVHVQYERMPNFCYWCGLLGHTVKECLTMPDEIDWKTFTEWPFQESLRASNSRDDGLLSGIAFSTDVSLSNKDQNDPPKRNNDGLRMVTYHESNDNQNSGRNLCTSYEGYPMSSATMSMGLEPLSNFEDLNHDKPNEGICSDTVKSKYDVQSRSKLESDGFGLDGDKIDCSRGSLNGSQVKFKNTGHVGAEIIAGPDLRQDEIGPEVISHTGRVDNKQCGAIKATQPKVWKKLVQKGLERNLRNETKDETSGGKRPIEDWVGEDIMDVDSVKKLKDNRDFNLTAAATPPTAMSILTWNVQGLGNPWTVQHLRSLVKEYSPTIMFLMETRIQDSETRGFKFIFTHYNMLVVSSTGRAGGLLLFWKKECDLTIQNFSTNHIDFVVKDDDGNSWRGTGIYGWPMQQEKYRTWALLRSLKTNQTQPWICFGDFNEVLYAFEKAGRRGCNNAQMEAFLEACNYCNLSNTSARGVKFTWSNGRRGTGNVKKRLDRFLANEEWLNLFSGAAFHNLARVASDHSPIVSRLLPHVKKKTMFRFENMWLRDESIHEVVNDAWANGVATGLDPCAIIGECAAKLSDWNKYSFGHVQRSIRSKEATLHILQSRFDQWRSQLF